MADDTLQSFQKVEIIDLLCEGPIEGIEGGNKGIYLNKTAIQDSTGQDNFEGYTVQTRLGTNDQTYIQQSNTIGSQRAYPFDHELLNSSTTGVVKVVNDTTTDRVRVTFTLASLLTQTDQGNIIGNGVEIEILTKYQGDNTYTSVKKIIIEGKSSSGYQRSYMFPLSGNFPVSIKVTRNTADNEGNSSDQNTIRWTSLTEITDEKFRYPNSAICYLKFDSENFNGIPKRRYLVKGLKIKIPTGVTVDSSTGRIIYPDNYVWNGTFNNSVQWCSDPAWSLWDLITNTRYGAAIPESSLDRWDFLNVSQYCNQMVPNGKGGEEPRFSLNLYIHSRKEIFNAINDLISAFRGMGYYSAGSLSLTSDRPRSSQYILSASNVIGGIFAYSGTSQKVRHTTATVAWQDYDLLGEVQYEYVEDVDGISRYGINNKESKAVGCYSQGQAHRYGQWMLLSEQLLTETVSFGVSIDSGIVLQPGMVISIVDSTKTGIRRGGRISSVTSTTVFNVDSDHQFSTIDADNNPKCSVILPSGIVETKACTIDGTKITLSEALSEIPKAEAPWLIETDDGGTAQEYRVLAIAQRDRTTFDVTALLYNESIYGSVDSDKLITIPDTTNLTSVPLQPINISHKEVLYEDGKNVRTKCLLSWSYPNENIDVEGGQVTIPVPPSFYKVRYRLNKNSWTEVTTTAHSIEILELQAGDLAIQVQALNSLGLGGRPASTNVILEGKLGLPEGVSNLRFENAPDPGLGRLTWDATTSLDVKVGGRVLIRHTSALGSDATWTNSQNLITAVPGHSTEALIPKLKGTVFVKFADDGGRLSQNSASIAINSEGQKTQRLNIISHREDLTGSSSGAFNLSSPFPSNSKTNTEYSSSEDVLKITLDNGKVRPLGTYEFANVLDLEGSFSLDIQKYFFGGGSYLSGLMDSWVSVDDRTDWDGGDVDKVDSWIDVYVTDDDPTSSPTWSTPTPLTKGTFTGRAFKFIANLQSTNVEQNMHIDNLGYIAGFEQRTEQSTEKANSVVTSETNVTTVQFSKAFWTGTSVLGGSTTKYLPSVNVVVYGMATGDYIDMGTVTGSQFTFTIKNSAGQATIKEYTWMAVGYGRAV